MLWGMGRGGGALKHLQIKKKNTLTNIVINDEEILRIIFFKKLLGGGRDWMTWFKETYLRFNSFCFVLFCNYPFVQLWKFNLRNQNSGVGKA